MADRPSQIAVAVYVHRVWSATAERDRAQAAYRAAISAARTAGISIKGLKAAMFALKHGRLLGLSADAQAVVDAVQSVPMIGVEIDGIDAGAFFDTRDTRTVTPDNDGATL